MSREKSNSGTIEDDIDDISSKNNEDGDDVEDDDDDVGANGPYAILHRGSIIDKLKFWIVCLGYSDKGWTDEVLPMVQLVLIFECGASITAGLPSRKATRYGQMLQKYISLTTSLLEVHHVIGQSQLKIFHSICGAHKIPTKVSEWPDPEKLYAKFTAIKSILMNSIMPHCPKEVKDNKNLPSGKGLKEYMKKWLMELYINDMHLKMAKSKKMEDRTKEMIRQSIGNNPLNIPID
jgi:hypothetical protein